MTTCLECGAKLDSCCCYLLNVGANAYKNNKIGQVIIVGYSIFSVLWKDEGTVMYYKKDWHKFATPSTPSTQIDGLFFSS